MFCTCNSGKSKVVEQNISSLLNEDVAWLKGKQIHSLDSVTGKIEGSTIVYIFNYYDCEVCIDRGFEVVNFIDSKRNEESIKVIVSMFHKVASTQKRNSYKGFIYKDKKDLIRKGLKYVPTPIMLIVDNELRIKDAYIFEVSQDNKQLKGFIQKCLFIDPHYCGSEVLL